MAAENAGTVYSEVRIKLDKLRQDIVEATVALDRFETGVSTSAEKTSKKATSSFNAMSIAAVAASAAIVGAFRGMITASAAYSQAMSDVQAATRGTAQDLKALEGAASAAGDELGTSTTDALGAVEALAKAGVSTADIMGGALPGALTLAAAGSMDVADAAEIAAATMTQFGLAGSDVTHIADLLAAGAGKAQGEVSDLSQALKQAGLVASQTGLSVDDTVGSLAAFASAGLLGSDAGTSFRTMLLRLTPQSKEAADEMKKLGINAFNSKGEFIGITKFAGQLQEQLKSLTTEQRNSSLATIFGSDSIRAANVLYTQGSEGIASWIDKVNDSGFAAETARIKLDNLAGDMKKFGAATEDAGAAVGKSLNPALRFATQAGAALFEFIAKIPAPILALIGTVGGLAGAILAVAAAGPPVVAALTAIGAAAATALGPIGLTVTALGLLAGAVVATSAAINAEANKKAFERFGDIAKGTGLTGEALDKFGETVVKVERALAALSNSGVTVTREQFENMAKSAKLSNDQLALIVGRSDKASAQLKKLAASFEDPARKAKEFAANQNAQANAIIERYVAMSEAGKKFAEDSTTATQEELDEQVRLYTAQERSVRDIIEARRHDVEAAAAAETLAIEASNADAIEQYRLRESAVRDIIEARMHATTEAQKEEAKETTAFLVNLTLTAADAIGQALISIFEALNQREIDALTARYDTERELIENNGLTKEQALQKALADAKAGGDAEKIAEAEKQLKLFTLEKEFQQKKAQLEFNAAHQSWLLQVALATAQAAQATLNAFSSTAAIPIIGPGLAPGAATVAAAIGALQIAAVVASEPHPPKFETGGIVLGNSFSGDKVPALVNSGEMILTREQQAQLFKQANGETTGAGSPQLVTVVLQIDSRTVAQSTVNWINSGQIRVVLK